MRLLAVVAALSLSACLAPFAPADLDEAARAAAQGAGDGAVASVVPHASGCPGHWHIVVALYVEGARVEARQPPHSLRAEGGSMPVRVHMHQGNDLVLHLEPAQPSCLALRDTLAFRGLDVRADGLTIDAAHSWSGSLAAAELRAFVPGKDDPAARVEAPWTEVAAAGQVPDRFRLLVVAGAASDADLDAWWDAARHPA